jgi:hypothetical protein
VVSSSRGCFEKTEKKTTPPLSGGALIRADKRESFSADFHTFMSFFPSFCPKHTQKKIFQSFYTNVVFLSHSRAKVIVPRIP